MRKTTVINLPEAERLQSEMLRSGGLPLWTVYSGARDFPNNIVGRMHVADGDGARATEFAVVGKTVKEVRNKLPRGLHRLERHHDDDPQIVETWV